MKSMKELHTKKTQSNFDKKVLSVLQHLHPYVKHRLYVAECKGIVPKNLYISTGIIDDAIIEIYKDKREDESAEKIKLDLFNKVDEHLDTLFAKEQEHAQGENSDEFLKGELQSLEVQYFVDADMDTVLFRDLDDISYKQDGEFTNNSSNKHVLGCLDIHQELYHSESATVGKFYNWLPEQVSNIIDLQMFGRLTAREIASLKNLDVEKVNKLLTAIPQRFREHIHN